MRGPKAIATSLFGRIVDKYGYMFSIVRTTLPKADIKIPFRTYMSMALFISVFAFASTLVLLVFALRFIDVSATMKIIFMIFVPLADGISCFAILFLYPMQKTGSRRKNIEANLPFVLTHMGAVAESGVPPYVIFRLIAEFDEYGEVSKEMKKVVRNIDVFGVDPLSAVRKVAERTPSDSLKQVLLGFVTTTESGGNVKIFLKSAGQQALFDWRMKRERFLQQLSAYAEFYTGLLIAAPLFIIALFAVMNMIQPTVAGYDILTLTKMSIYIVVPGLNGGFLLFLKGTEMEM